MQATLTASTACVGWGFSSSEFSPRDPLAKYQDDVVKHYLATCDKSPPFPPPDAFDPTGRATPDIAALGEGYNVILDGHVQSIGGTSASTPAFAGLVSLINEALLAKGGKPLGFLNPFIYQNIDAWTDVVKGTNAIGRGNGPLPYGYSECSSACICALPQDFDCHLCSFRLHTGLGSGYRCVKTPTVQIRCVASWRRLIGALLLGLGTPLFDKLLAAALKAGGH